MYLESPRALRGPNSWSDATLLHAVLRTDPGDAPDFARLRTMAAAAEIDVPEGVFESRARGAQTELGLAKACVELTLALERAVGAAVAFSEVHAGAEPRQYRVWVEYREEDVGRAALTLAYDLLRACHNGSELDLGRRLGELRCLDQKVRLGPSTGAIVAAAVARGIPARRLTSGSLVALGQGVSQRRIWAAETDRTSAIGETIAQNKELTKSLLDAIGVPVPKGRTVDSAEEAWQAGLEIGLPVAVKPRDGNQGRGVSVALGTRDDVMAAFEVAARESRAVMVERHLEGADHRLLVIGGRLVAAARREPPQVVGDGRHSIAELVGIENQDPRRSDGHATVLSHLRLDDIALEVLAKQGLAPESVPGLGRTVLLRRNANLSTGGTASDITDEVHPEVAARAVEAAAMVGLDIAGIDVVAPAIDRPLEETGGGIVEVNAAPGLRMHLEPSCGRPRPVGEAIIDMMFQSGETGRIPIVAVTGTNGKTTTTRCIQHLLRSIGWKVGMTCTDGIFVDDRRIDTGDCSGPKSARTVLSHPEVHAAVLETARGGILREGLGFDWCDVAVVTNIADGDHLGMGGVETAEQLAKVKQTIVRRVSERGAAVLNAEDPLVVAMAGQCRGKVIFCARSHDQPVLAAHRARGGHAVFVRGGWISAAIGNREWLIAPLDKVPLTRGGRIGFHVDNVIAATAAAWFLGLPIDRVRTALEEFSGDVDTVPGRFNVLTCGKGTVVLDYGHNASALLALVEALENLPHTWRSIVYTAAGDRRDRDILQQASIIGNSFDEVFLYEDQCTRGRPDGEVIRLMREGLIGTCRVSRVHELCGELAAIHAALSGIGPGGLLLCQVDQVEKALAFVQSEVRRLAPRMVSGFRPAVLASGVPETAVEGVTAQTR